MPRYEYRLVDVFTSQRFAGNPLAVFPRADGIAAADMQRIAREFNLSETTFVLSTAHPGCDYQVRIFTPDIEMPMAGHPTIGTAYVLDHGTRVTFLEQVGPIVVERVAGDAGATTWRMTQPLPQWGPQLTDRAEVATVLGLAPDDLAAELPIEVISTGAPFLFVPLRNLDALARARAQLDRWNALAPRLAGAHGAFCFTTRTGDPNVTVRSRMFAPGAGVAEDPATGSASGPLGCYLVRHGIVAAGRPAKMLSLQGVEIDHPSYIHIEIDGGPDAFSGVRVAGECVAVGGGWIEL
jgi:trans-2,3-dihydro-3-hydroxyanthranilate isomerase